MFYGHTHVREQHRTGKTLVANPGALFRANPKTCIVLDLATGEIKPIIVPVPKPPAVTVDEGMGSVLRAATAPSVPPPEVTKDQ